MIGVPYTTGKLGRGRGGAPIGLEKTEQDRFKEWSEAVRRR